MVITQGYDVKYVKYRRAGPTQSLCEKSGKEENLKSPVRLGGRQLLMTSRFDCQTIVR